MTSLKVCDVICTQLPKPTSHNNSAESSSKRKLSRTSKKLDNSLAAAADDDTPTLGILRMDEDEDAQQQTTELTPVLVSPKRGRPKKVVKDVQGVHHKALNQFILLQVIDFMIICQRTPQSLCLTRRRPLQTSRKHPQGLTKLSQPLQRLPSSHQQVISSLTLPLCLTRVAQSQKLHLRPRPKLAQAGRRRPRNRSLSQLKKRH